VENAIHCINHYPADSVVCFSTFFHWMAICLGGKRYPAFKQKGPGYYYTRKFMVNDCSKMTAADTVSVTSKALKLFDTRMNTCLMITSPPASCTFGFQHRMRLS